MRGFNISGSTSIGQRSDKSFSNADIPPTVQGHLTASYFHIHDSAKVYPTGSGNFGAAPITITSSTTAWEHGSKAQIVPLDTILVWFDIHWIVSSNPSAVGDYELRLYSGDVGEETQIAAVAFSRSTVQDRDSVYIPVQIPPQPMKSRITASLASNNAAADTVDIKIYYHTYPDVTAESL